MPNSVHSSSIVSFMASKDIIWKGEKGIYMYFPVLQDLSSII